MPVPASPSIITLDTSAPARATFKPITVVGTLAIPALTYVQAFHSSTSLLDVAGACLQNLDAQYKSLFGLNEEIELGETEFLSPLKNGGWCDYTRCSDLRTDENTVSELIIHYYLSDRQNDSLIHLIPDYKDKVSSLSTEALLLHEDLKAQEVAGTAAEMANAGRKHRRSSASHSPPSSPIRLCSALLNDEGVELSIDGLKSETAMLRAERVCLQKNADNREAKIKALEREVKDLTNANNTLSDTLGLHIAKLHALHRRVLLDLAREKLLERFPIAERMNSRKLAETLVSRRAADDREELPDRAVRMVCSGTLREDGNLAAHQASFDDLSQSALDASLMQSERETLKNIFIYVFGAEPVLSS